MFINGLSPALAKFAPSVSAATLIKAGATNVRSVVPKDQLQNVLKAYNQALTQTYVSYPSFRGAKFELTNSLQYLAVGCSCIGFIMCFGLGWNKVKKSQKKGKVVTDVGKIEEAGLTSEKEVSKA